MTVWRRGEFVEFNNDVAVVVGIAGEADVPDGHVALWFGEVDGFTKAHDGTGGKLPVVWTVPADYCRPANPPDMRH